MNLSLRWKSSLLLAANLLSLPLAGSPWLAISPSSIGRAGTETGFREGYSVLQGNPATSAVHRQFSITGGYTYNEFNQGDYVAWADQLFQDFSASGSNIDGAFGNILNGTNANPAGDLAVINRYLTENASRLNGPESGTQIIKQGNLQINWNRFGLKLGNAKYMGVHSMYDSRGRFDTETGANFVTNYDLSDFGTPNINSFATLDKVFAAAGSTTSAFTVYEQRQVQDLINVTEAEHGVAPDGLSEDSINLLGQMVAQIADLTGSSTTPAASSAELDNFSGLKLVHFDLKEAEWSFGFSLFEDHLHITPSVKYMHGKVSGQFLKLTNPASNSTDILDALEDEPNIVHSDGFDIDLGMMFTLGKRWTFGIQTTNLLSPSFDAPTGFADVKLDPTLRIGTAYRYSLSEDFGGSVGIDFDVIENESPIIPDFNRRMFSIGIEQGLSRYLNLHLGTGVNTAARDTTWIFSTGLGVRVSHFFLDTAITGTTDSTKIEGDRISNAGGYGISLGYNMNL